VTPLPDGLRVAVVHDWLVRVDGSVRLLGEILRCFPGADLFTLIDLLADADRARYLGGRRSKSTALRHAPGIRRLYWYYVPLMPRALRGIDLRGYDLVVTSSATVVKGVRTHPGQAHVAYVHSPMRFAWDLEAYYLRRFGWDRGARKLLATQAFGRLREWDRGSNGGIDVLLANSAYVARRIERCWGLPSRVLHPAVSLERFTPRTEHDGYYLTAAFMNPFKNVGLIVRTFSAMPARRLIVVGDGPERDAIAAMAGSNVELRGAVDDAELARLMGGARAFVYAAPEDFGIVMVEAQAAGTPVIALGEGGACEIVRGLNDADPTGVLYADATERALAAAVERFEAEEHRIDRERCRRNALRFTPAAFQAGLLHAAREALAMHGRTTD
jgi:glycosyltransferase involved in cell wall biosynthesis